MEAREESFPGDSDNYLAITGAAHPFLSGAETFYNPSLGDEEFEIPPILLESDLSLGQFEDLAELWGLPEPPFVPSPYEMGGLELPMGLPPDIMEQGGGLLNMELEEFGAAPLVTIEVPMGDLSPGGLLVPEGALATIDQHELSSQLDLRMGDPAPAPPDPAPPTNPDPVVSPGLSPPAGSPQDDQGDDFQRLPATTAPTLTALAPPLPVAPPPVEPPRRLKPPKKPKKKKDPNAPQKPLSAYARFFRETQAAIKGQNPNTTFGEISKIVASMWDSLGEEQKQVYKRKTEAAKKEYLKALMAYQTTLGNTGSFADCRQGQYIKQ